MIDRKNLLTDLRRELRRLERDLTEQAERVPEMASSLESEYRAARGAGRTGETFLAWRRGALTQAAVAWLLGCVFVRFAEDNGLIDEPLIAGSAERNARAADRQTIYFRDHPTDSDRDYLLDVFAAVSELPGMTRLYDRVHNPVPDYVPSSAGLLRIILGEFEHSVGHGRGSQGDECESGKHLPEREATIEPVGELGEVPWQVFGTQAVVGAMQGAFDIAQDGVDPGELRMFDAGRSPSGHERLVKTPCVLHRAEAGQPIGYHDGAGLEVAPCPSFNLLAAKSTDATQAHPHRPALAIEFHGGQERRFARRASPAFATAAFSAPIRIIELHPAAQRARVVALLHHLHQLVLDLPSGVVAHRKLPRQLQCRNPVLRLRHQVHRQEPGA